MPIGHRAWLGGHKHTWERTYHGKEQENIPVTPRERIELTLIVALGSAIGFLLASMVAYWRGW